MRVEKKKFGDKVGYYIICSDEEFKEIKPFLLKHDPNFLDGKVSEFKEKTENV